MSIREAVESAGDYLTQHPDEARYRDSPARARLVDGLVVEVEGADGARLRTDMPRGIGGTGSAPSPGWLLRAAVASCVASLVAIRAAAIRVPLGGIEVEVDSESDDRGILGLDDAIPAGPLNARIVISVHAPARSRADLQDLARWAVDHCPVSEMLGRVVPVEVDIQLSPDPDPHQDRRLPPR
jgi:uncharacterized OsmC-like protein